MGSNIAACRAGKTPKTKPILPDIVTATAIAYRGN